MARWVKTVLALLVGCGIGYLLGRLFGPPPDWVIWVALAFPWVYWGVRAYTDKKKGAPDAQDDRH
jgi:hypothetical protein